MTQNITLSFTAFLLIILLLTLFSHHVNSNTWPGSKYQIECTMCAACDNPCNPPVVPSPPPPVPSPPPPTPSPPPPSSSINCPPPPSSGGYYYYSPPPPSQPNYGNNPPTNTGSYYPPPAKNYYPTPPPPNPITSYFPFYYHAPPPRNPAADISRPIFVNSVTVFLVLICYLFF